MIFDILGWIGMVLVLLAYGLLSTNKISNGKLYQILNFIAALFMAIKVVKVEINDKGIFIDDNEIQQDENKVYSFEFEDKLIEVPNTGDTRKIDKLIGIVGMSFATLMAIFIRLILKKKNNN